MLGSDLRNCTCSHALSVLQVVGSRVKLILCMRLLSCALVRLVANPTTATLSVYDCIM